MSLKTVFLMEDGSRFSVGPLFASLFGAGRQFLFFLLVLKMISFTKSLTYFILQSLFSVSFSFTHFDSVNKKAFSAVKSRGA